MSSFQVYKQYLPQQALPNRNTATAFMQLPCHNGYEKSSRPVGASRTMTR